MQQQAVPALRPESPGAEQQIKADRQARVEQERQIVDKAQTVDGDQRQGADFGFMQMGEQQQRSCQDKDGQPGEQQNRQIT